MDIYSLGMVCLWILFKHELLKYISTLTENTKESATTGIARLQDEDQLPDVAAMLIESQNGLDSQQRFQLREFFRLTLQKRADLREGSVRNLIRLLDSTGRE